MAKATRAAFGDLLEPGFREILFQVWDMYPEEYSKVFNMLKSTKKKEMDSGISGLGSMPEKVEGGNIAYDVPILGWDVTYTHVTYGLGFRVTREMYEDDLYATMAKMPKALARSAAYTVEVVAAAVLNNAFTVAGGGTRNEYLCATNHVLSGGGTEQNKLTTDADLAVTSLETAIGNIEETVDDKGLLMALRCRRLIIPHQLKWVARELLGSDKKPYTANNEINALLDEDLTYFVYHYLTDPDAWFMLSDRHELNFFWRRPLDFGQGEDFDSEDAKYKSTMRFSVGWTDWKGIFGSPGA